MSHPKIKTEGYANVKGINQKTSVYQTDDQSILELENYDFQVPGAWSKRWGTTNATANTTLTFAGRPVVDMITSWNNAFGLNNLVFTDTTPYIYTYDGSKYVGATNGILNYIKYGGETTPIYQSASPTPVNSRNFNFITMWTTGVTIYKFSADAFVGGAGLGVFSQPQPGPLVGGTFSSFGSGGGFTGVYAYAWGYRDPFGFVVPGIRPFSGFFGPTNGFSYTVTTGATMVQITGLPSSLPVPNTYGATSLVIYRNRVEGYPPSEVVSVAEILLGSTTTFRDAPGSYNLIGYPLPTNNFFPTSRYTTIDYIEVYSNRTWFGTRQTNTLFWSEIQAPQVIEPENSVDIVSNESEMMGLKMYNQSLIVAMRKGVWRLAGDPATSLSLLELTKEYGTVANKSMVVWKERLWFLDEGQIMEFNGSNFVKTSDAVQSLLQSVDYTVAEQRVSSIHFEDRNEVWFSLPIAGSSFNTLLVYDYLVEAWTTFKGIQATSLASLYTEDNPTASSGVFLTERNPKVFYGSQGGTLYYFEPTFKTDSGLGISCAFRTKYHMPFPKTATAQFRRFWVDTGPISGTQTFHLSFYANYSTAINSTMALVTSSSPNKRVEFGIPAKSLSTKVVHVSGNEDHVVYGYTVESRFQRNV
jgi:hypothetical protein